jgi:hypothetical protein
MKEYGTTEEVATEALWNMVENAWTDMNKEYLTMTSIPSTLILHVINLSRMMETMFREIDGYTDSAILEKHISLLVEKPITF